jgi:hypothetical protein
MQTPAFLARQNGYRSPGRMTKVGTSRVAHDRPANVPSVASHVYGLTSRLFEPKDVSILIKLAGHSKSDRTVDRPDIAKQLSNVFIDCIMMSSLERQSASNESSAWLDQIELSAMTLLNTLGFSANDWVSGGGSLGSINLIPAFDNLLTGIVHGRGPFPAGIPGDLRRVFGDERFRKAIHLSRQIIEESGDEFSAVDRCRTMGGEAARALLPLVPRILGLLIALARGVRASERQGSHRRGRRTDDVRKGLFPRLVLIHRDLTGGFPVTRDKLGQRLPNPTSVRWLRHVIVTAADRLARENDSLMIAGSGWLKRMTELSDASLADFIESGNAAAKRSLRGN